MEAKGSGRLLWPVRGRGPGRWALAGPPVRDHGSHDHLPQVVVHGSRRDPAAKDARRVPEGRRRPEEKGASRRPNVKPHLRGRPGVGIPNPLGLRRRRDGPDREEGGPRPQGNDRIREMDGGVLERGLRRGRAGVGRHQQQSGLPRRRDQRDPEWSLDLPPGQTQGRRDQGREGRPMWMDISHFPIPDGPAGPTPRYHVAFSHAVMKYSKNQKAAKELLRWLHSKEQFGKWFEIEAGFSVGATTFWEKHALWERTDEALKPFRTAGRVSRMIGYAGPRSEE